ncbi:MAG: hypothetical protein ACREX9_10570 [Gammaproteobacteria bacterium]
MNPATRGSPRFTQMLTSPRVCENTGFEFPLREDLTTVPMPLPEMVELIRAMDPFTGP